MRLFNKFFTKKTPAAHEPAQQTPRQASQQAGPAASGVLFFSRHPVFACADGAVAGHVVLLGGLDPGGELHCATGLTDFEIVPEAYARARLAMCQTALAFVDLPAEALDDEHVLSLSTESCVLAPHGEVNARTAEGLTEVGYRIAVDEAQATPDLAERLQGRGIMRLDFRSVKSSEDLRTRVDRAKKSGYVIMGANVDTPKRFEAARRLECDYATGLFFLVREERSEDEIPSSSINRLETLREITNEDFDTLEISKLIGADSSVAYRLLCYVNSAEFSLRREIKVLWEAISLMGQDRLIQWFEATVLSDLDPTPRGREVACMAVGRAKFLEQSMQHLSRPPRPPGTMFLLGLFSLLDVLMARPMESLVARLPLDEEVRRTLCGEMTQLSSYLDFAVRFEGTDINAMVKSCDRFGLALETALQARTDAAVWAHSMIANC